ncbi:MAG: hypothetical protein QOJ04_12 [Caballeronia sp.]|nr:hypothetical protein [Caballeronia sp.]
MCTQTSCHDSSVVVENCECINIPHNPHNDNLAGERPRSPRRRCAMCDVRNLSPAGVTIFGSQLNRSILYDWHKSSFAVPSIMPNEFVLVTSN